MSGHGTPGQTTSWGAGGVEGTLVFHFFWGAPLFNGLVLHGFARTSYPETSGLPMKQKGLSDQSSHQSCYCTTKKAYVGLGG